MNGFTVNCVINCNIVRILTFSGFFSKKAVKLL